MAVHKIDVDSPRIPTGSKSKRLVIALSLPMVLAVGAVDYLTGYELYFSLFYLVPVSMAAWYVGRTFGVGVSVVSILTWFTGDLAAGARYSTPLIPSWNAIIALGFYLVIVWLLTNLRALQQQLETRVRQRTLALTNEIAERERLEHEVLEITESERRRIGHDLHDSLGQHLTGTALAGQVLEETLAEKAVPEAADVGRLVLMIEEGIEITRRLSRGLHPVEVEAGGLTDGLRELAASTGEIRDIDCTFECDETVNIADASVATHLYRIAQEAISNAIRHGKARHIVVRLSENEGVATLTIKDDGIGIPEKSNLGVGMGLRIMKHRADMIAGEFSVVRDTSGGTSVRCRLRTQ